MLVTDHLLEQHLLKVDVVGLAERDIGCLEVFGELRGGAVVGSDVDGLVVSGEDDGRRAVVINVRVMSVANPKQISGYREEHSLAFINEGDPFARSHVDSAVEAVDDVQGSHLRVYEDFRVLAADDAQVLVSHFLLDRHYIAQPFKTDQLCI